MKNRTLPFNRRQFLKFCTIVGSGLIIGQGLQGCGPSAGSSENKPAGHVPEETLNAWIRIHEDNTTTIRVNHSEMGQGIATALCMIVAEELEADWSGVRFEMAPVDDVYRHPAYGIQWTVSSMSIQASWDRWRKAGASARELMIRAAARLWQVPADECRAESSHVLHPVTGKRLPYSALIHQTKGLTLPESPVLKPPDRFRLIGQSVRRLDSLPKIEGKAVFGMDVRLPGMLTATLIHPPMPGARAGSVDAETVLKQPGVRKVLIIRSGVAIVADTFWEAVSAMSHIKINWQDKDAVKISTDELFKRWHGLGKTKGTVQYKTGNPAESFKQGHGTRLVEAAYDLPYQAHATPEPMNCTAHVRKDGCEIWAPTQNPKGVQEIAAEITGLGNDRIIVHTTLLGGGFGRRALVDYAAEAVEISMKMNAPIKVIWTREEDITHDFFRAATHNLMKAVIDENGHPLAWLHRIVGADVFAQTLPQVITGMMPDALPRFVKTSVKGLAGMLLPRFLPGKKAITGAGPLPYDIRDMSVEFINDDPGIPLCWWRSVAPSTTCFAVECFIDELAAAAKRDPFDLRYELLGKTPRLQAVLKHAADLAGWFSPPPEGRHRGLAAHNFQETMMAMVAEISVSPKGLIRVHRVSCALDCGVAVNPGNIRAQVQSAVAFGLTAAIKSAVTFEGGRVRQSNFHDFPILRMDEMPLVEVHIVPSTNPPTGIGEVAVPPIGPAVANAVFAATGRRVRKLPIFREDLV